MKSILDPSFRYTPSVDTDIRKTFARARKAQRIADAAKAATRTADDAELVPHKARVFGNFQQRREAKGRT